MSEFARVVDWFGALCMAVVLVPLFGVVWLLLALGGQGQRDD